MTKPTTGGVEWLHRAERRARKVRLPSPPSGNGGGPDEEFYLVSWVGYKDVTGERIPLEEIIVGLRRFNRWNLLAVLAGLSQLLGSESLTDRKLQATLIRDLLEQGLAARVIEKALGKEVHLVFNRLQVLNLMKLALCYCPDHGARDPSTHEDLHAIGKLLLCLSDYLQSAEVPADDPVEEQKRALAEWMLKSLLFFSVERFPYAWVRYYFVYTRLMKLVPTSRKVARIGAQIRRLTGVSIDLLMAVGFGLLARWPDLREEDLEEGVPPPVLDVPSHFKNTRVTASAIDRVLARCSLPVGDLASRVGTELDIRDNRLYSVFRNLSVRQRPIVVKDGRQLLCLDKQYFMDRLTRGVYWSIFESLPGKEREDFASVFGDLIHEYAKRLLKRVFGRNYHLLRYRRGQEELADGVILCGSEVIVIEIKSARLLLKTQQDGDLEAFESDIDKIIIKGTSQISRAIEAIRERRIQLPGLAPGAELNYHPLLITAETFPFYRLLRDFVDVRIEAAGHLQGRRTAPLTIMRLEDLEVLEPILDEVRLLELLKRRNLDRRLRDMPFKAFIIEHFGETIPRNEWMHEEYERLATVIKRRLFGPGADPVKVE